MKLIARISILFAFVTIVFAYKTETWPPAVVYKHYNIDEIAKRSFERCGTDKKELMEFEMSEDMEHLPNSTGIRCYFRTFGELSESVDVKSNKLKLGKFGEFFADLTREEQEIYVNMSKGCARRARHIEDPFEFTYQMTLCFKQNDNKHFFIPY
ncbi:hypothetical protein Bhyg_14595 [Pseudolycoriella hygida]|uniref:Uncharacterized protein n=1 Tax=Pseudolycoriella hygida TaxID=35572 RepID=A0A9Q0RXK8_9DIPT|nr:hypothetical protein Bhyg_14595 [Pseudolycoriella hygida]